MKDTGDLDDERAREVQDLAAREAELRAQLAAIVESSDDAIISKSLQGIIRTWNRGAERIFGYTRDEVEGKSITILIPPERLNEEDLILSRLKSGERIEHYETIRLHKDGTPLNISLTVSPVRNSTGRIIGASKIARDITAQKRAEAERSQLLEAERAARMEAEHASRMKDEFLATMSHELRTPLSAIIGWVGILSSGAVNREQLAHGIATIARNARAQAQIIDDLLDMSRITAGKVRLEMQPVDLNKIVQTAVETILPTAQNKGVQVQFLIDPLPWPVTGDPNRLQQILWNLLTNAVKFTPAGGKVQLVLARVNAHVELSVADTGEGISPDFLPHVFDRFRQADSSTSRRHGGLGIGLSIVRQLVEMHGGTIVAKSAGAGQGSVFTITLPWTTGRVADAREDKESEIAPAPSELHLPSVNGLRVLIVDDEQDSRELLSHLLTANHAVVSTAADASEALSLLQSQKPEVLVSDIGMPGEDGYTLISKVRALGPAKGGAVPAVALTAYARPEDRRRALLAGYQMHLVKPADPAELITVLATLTRRADGEKQISP